MRPLLLLLLFSGLAGIGAAYAQPRTVSGQVTASADGSVLPGASIAVKGTGQGTTTDADGRYSLNNVPAGSTLVFSFVGFFGQEAAIGNQTTVSAALRANAQELSEVIVTALGLEQNRDQYGNAASQVKGGQVARSGEATLINGLAGKASGVIIQRSTGDPGAGSYIQIRGQSSVTGNLQPLIILDGVPMTNSSVLSNGIPNTGGVAQQSRLNDINPEDIASVEVLKGAGAAAIWGTRAANGVLVITTKRGTAGKGKINVNVKSTVSFDRIYKTQPMQTLYGAGRGGLYQFEPTGGRSWAMK